VHRLGQRFQIRDDRFRVRRIHVVGVHWWPQRFTVRANSLFENSQTVFLCETRKTCQSWRLICPIGNRAHRGYPDRCTLQPRVALQFALGVTRGVALGTFGDLVDQIFAAFHFTLIGSKQTEICLSLGARNVPGRPPPTVVTNDSRKCRKLGPEIARKSKLGAGTVRPFPTVFARQRRLSRPALTG
jgi:hypothetical protein